MPDSECPPQGPEEEAGEEIEETIRRAREAIRRRDGSIPEEEEWIWENPEIARGILCAVESLRQGRSVYKGDFAQFAEEDEPNA